MRKSKSETIAENINEFLAEKSDDYKNKFYQKSESQQYAAINHWLKSAKNLGVATKGLAKVTASTVMGYLKDAHKKLVKLETLSPKEAQKIQELLDKVKGAIDDFDRIKKQQLIEVLKSEKEKLAKQNEILDNQIRDLQNQLQ